jgi:hypothetical protein
MNARKQKSRPSALCCGRLVRPCTVCQLREQSGSGLCDQCAKSFLKVGYSTYDVIEWTAARTRYFASRGPNVRPIACEANRSALISTYMHCDGLTLADAEAKFKRESRKAWAHACV